MDFVLSIRVAAAIIGFGLFMGCKSGNSRSQTQNLETRKVDVALAGNAYQTNPNGTDAIGKNGIESWKDDQSVFSIYLEVKDATKAKVFLRGKISSGKSKLSVQIGNTTHQVEVKNKNFKTISAGEFLVKNDGYTRIDLKGIDKSGNRFGQITDLILKVPQTAKLTYVKDNKKNRYYWGRRGPSVHLQYHLPKDKDAEWFYNEVTVPKGQDPVGSYFMANGFAQGYFGIQVNGKDERHVLFSVWSPYKTDDPDAVPDSEKIRSLKKGAGVVAKKFGDEGSGGQSYWVYPWKAGRTYKFLNKVKPDGNGNTINTAYFYAPKLGHWKLIASFLRPQTDTWLTGAYSFLENFKDSNGFKTRKAFYSNQWFRDKNGGWYPLRTATFTGDDIAYRGYRVDYSGGADGGRFYLKNGGFFVGETPLKTDLNRDMSSKYPPDIDFSKLP